MYSSGILSDGENWEACLEEYRVSSVFFAKGMLDAPQTFLTQSSIILGMSMPKDGLIYPAFTPLRERTARLLDTFP